MSTSWIFDQTFFWVPVLLIRDSRVPQKFDVYHTNLTCSMPWGVSFYWTETSQWKQRVWFGSSKLIFDLQIRCDRPCFSGLLECNIVLARQKATSFYLCASVWVGVFRRLSSKRRWAWVPRRPRTGTRPCRRRFARTWPPRGSRTSAGPSSQLASRRICH